MAQGSRVSRVGDQLRAEIGDLLARSVQDPGLGFTTITHVQVSADLSHARVFYTCLGSAEQRRDTAAALRRASSFLRREVGRRVRLKRVPELSFAYDEALERQDRVQRLLDAIEPASADDAGASDGNEPTGDRSSDASRQEDDD